MHKAWICLFTCAATRAIHFDNFSNTFLKALRRFISRHGKPLRIMSDNATTFKSNEVQSFASSLGITWQFNPPAAPWWGGFFERMVQIVKRCLRKVLYGARVSYDEMCTVLAEVECIVNDRPLTYTYSDLNEEVITPNHLMYGRRLLNEVDTNISLTTDFNTRQKYMYRLSEHFLRRWKCEYLAELREKHTYIRRKQGTDVINVDDVVLIHEDRKPRSRWRMGVVNELCIALVMDVFALQLLRL